MSTTLDTLMSKHDIKLKDDELAHYGKKGMRWGKSSAKSKAKAEALARPKAEDLNDSDLKSAINRLKMEKEYRQLTAPEVSRGRKIVGDILTDVGKQQAKSYLNGEIGKLMNPTEADVINKAVKTALKNPPKSKVFKPTPNGHVPSADEKNPVFNVRSF